MAQSPSTRILSLLIGIVLCLGLLALGITREVPYGGIIGKVTMQENSKALPFADVELRPIVVDPDQTWQPTDNDRPTYRAESDKNGRFSIPNIAAGEYELAIVGRAHSLRDRRITIQEGKPNEMEFELEPQAPYLDLYASQKIFLPKEAIELSLTGFGKEEAIQVTTYRLNPNKILAGSSLYNVLAPLASTSYQVQKVKPTERGEIVDQYETKIQSRDVEGVFNERLEVKQQVEGLYWIECKYGDKLRGTWFSVTNLALVTKEAAGQFTVFATHLETGVAQSGVQIGYQNGAEFKVVATTNSNGIASFKIDPSQRQEGVLMGVQGNSRAFIDLRVSQSENAKTRVLTYTDRPVYRPGDEVNYRGIIRQVEGNGYRRPQPGTATIEVYDTDYTLVQREEVQVNPWGSYSGKFTLNREMKPGMASIKTKFGNAESTSEVSVSEYRKPEFSIKVEPLKSYYVRGELIRMEVSCEYFFGGPVQNATINAVVRRAPIWDFGPIGDDFEDLEDSEWSYGGEYITDFEVKTDSSGRAVVEFPSTIAREQASIYEDSDIRYTLEVSATDESGKYFDGSGTVKVLRSKVGVYVEPAAWVTQPNVPVSAKIKVYDALDSKPIANQNIEVEAGFDVWQGTTSRFVPFATQTLRTNNLGFASVTVTPFKGGELRIRARAQDSEGASAQSTGYVWVHDAAGEYSYAPMKEGEINIRLDKRQYKERDKATVLIEASDPGGDALVTIEADKVYLSQRVKLDKPVTLVKLDIVPDHAPVAFVTVSYIKNKEFGYRERKLKIDLTRRQMNVAISSDRATYEPGDEAEYTITTTNPDGTPVSAEMSFGLVDESIYAIQEDRTDILGTFYPARWNSVRTTFSFEEIYLDGGDKAPKNIEIRRVFKDTAYWNPSIVTDSRGRAKVRLKLPDNLTSWRATAVGMTADSRAGQAKMNIRARKPLMLRLQAPAFLVQKDSQRLLAQITNDSGKDATVNVEISTENATLQGEKRQSVQVKNGATAKVEWNVTVPETGTAVFTGKAWIDDSINDGVELKVRVAPHGRLYQETSAEIVQGEKELNVVVREGADSGTGRLKITIEPSIAGVLVGSLDDLIDYPYGCVEQTMSRFLPLVVVTDAVRKGGLPAPEQAAEIPKMVSEGLTRLKNMQAYNGTWGWMSFDEGDEYMTGYVLEGLARAKYAGFEVNPYMLNRSKTYAQEALKTSVKEKLEPELKSLLPKDKEARRSWREPQLRRGRIQFIFGLAVNGLVEPSQVKSDDLVPADNSPESVATLALLYRAWGNQAMSDRWMNVLDTMATRTEGTLSWPEAYGSEATARALLAKVALEPESTDIQLILRHLMLQRRSGGWMSTKDTSAVLIALASYLPKTQELTASGPVEVLVNGETVLQTELTPNAINDPRLTIEVPFNKLKPGDNAIVVRRPVGVAYVTIDLRQWVVQDSIAPLSTVSDMTISRSYYTLGTSKLEDGRLTVLPSERPIQSASAGDNVKVVVTVKNTAFKQYVMIEDPIPSNCRINERTQLDDPSEWTYWWSDASVREDRMVFFVTNLPAGEHTLTYVLRAENPGDATALPAILSIMYDPDKRASTGSARFTVRPK